MGLGHFRQQTGAELREALRLRHRAEWAHSSDDTEGGGQRQLPHGDVDSVPLACSWERTVAGPMKVPAEKLRGPLGICQVEFVAHPEQLAIVDSDAGVVGCSP